MRNFRKISAVVVAAALTLTTFAPAFAAYSPVNGEKAAVLNQLDLYAGTDTNKFNPSLDSKLTRGQGAVLLAKLFNMDDAALALTEAETAAILKDFADGAKVPDWAKQRIAYLVKNNVMAGSLNTTTGELNINADMDLRGGEFATLILKQMGYEVADWKTAIDQLAEVDGAKDIADYLEFGTSSILRDQAVGIVYGSLTADYAAAGTETVIDKIVAENPAIKAVAEAAGLLTVAPVELAVESVKALNLREVQISFNKSVDIDEAKKVTNYEINDNNPASVTVSADGKTVTLLTSHANRLGNYATDTKLEIFKAVGFAADQTITSIAAKDVTVPSMVSVEATGPRNIKVTFSEPLNETVSISNTVNSFKLDNGTAALDSTVVSYNGNVLTLKTLGDLKEGEHTLAVKNDAANLLVDSAAYGVSPTSATFNYVKDTSPLTVSVVESTETTATIKFNKPINPATLVGNADVKIRHTYNTTINQVTGAAVTNTGDDQQFVVSFPDNMPFAPGASNLYIVYTNDTSIKDNYGNKLAEATLVVNTTADLTKPVITKVEFISATSLEVTFSEKVQAGTGANGAENKALYTLKDSTGALISITGAAFKSGSGDKVVVLTTAQMNGGSYTLAVKDIFDVSIAKNELDDVTVSFTGVDKVAPTVSSTKQIGANKVKVTFSEAMDSATITDKANWKHNTAALDADDKIEAVDANKAIIITFKSNLDLTDGNSDGVLDNESLTLARVKDVAGNWSANFSETLSVTKVVNVTYTKAEMIATDKIRLTFEDEVISGATTSDFEVSFNGATSWTAISVVGMSVSVVDGDTIIELTTSEKATNTTATDVQVRTAGGVATVGAMNAYDTKLLFTAATLVDKVAPAIAKVETKDINSNGKLDSIEVTYSEVLYVASVADSDYTVEGYKITGVSVSGNKVTITVEELTIADDNATPKVTQVGEIQDLQRNTLGAQDAVTAIDGI